MEKEQRIAEINVEIEKLPRGNVTYKKINGKQQPYLQWSENGRCRSYYIKANEKENILLEVKKRRTLEEERRLLEFYSVEVAKILSKQPTLKGKPYIGSENFRDYCNEKILYVDKTRFIKEWWESNEKVTLITRPRRFGKSLLFSTVEHFFSPLHSEVHSYFDNLYIMGQSDYKKIIGTYPVMRFSFAPYKMGRIEDLIGGIRFTLHNLYIDYRFMLDSESIDDNTKEIYMGYLDGEGDNSLIYIFDAIQFLSRVMYISLGHGPIILIDEYDTPIQEAYLKGEWNDMADFCRSFFNAALKSNKYLERAILTGVTYIAKESFFSDMNNIYINTVTSDKYCDSFGFTEEEVSTILKCHDNDEMEKVKELYDGFTFGHCENIYNPWSIVCYLNEKLFKGYWIMSGGTSLASRAILNNGETVMDEIHRLMNNETIHKRFKESIMYQALDYEEEAIWALLLCSGLLTASNPIHDVGYLECDLRITNKETWYAYEEIINSWMSSVKFYRNLFCKYLINGDLENMNDYMNEITLEIISNFDVDSKPSKRIPERFYHGFVLGMLVELRNEYTIESNRESGLGRYDVMMIPKRDNLDGIIIEFKVKNERKESTLEETADNALRQIEEKNYQQELISKGIDQKRIRKYGFAFEGKEVLIKTLRQNIEMGV